MIKLTNRQRLLLYIFDINAEFSKVQRLLLICPSLLLNQIEKTENYVDNIKVTKVFRIYEQSVRNFEKMLVISKKFLLGYVMNKMLFLFYSVNTFRTETVLKTAAL